jgi:hypothetical protein
MAAVSYAATYPSIRRPSAFNQKIIHTHTGRFYFVQSLGLQKKNLIMKKILLFTILVYCANVLQAQIQFGVKAGSNISNLHASSGGNSYPGKAGAIAGGLVSIALPGHFSLQPELLYSSEGIKINGSAGAWFKETDNFLAIPVLLAYKLPSGFFAELGPQPGFLLNQNSTSDKFASIEQFSKSVAFSGVAGIGFLSHCNIGADARYSLMFANGNKANVVTIDGAPFTGSSSFRRNTVLQLDIFYLFGRVKK